MNSIRKQYHFIYKITNNINGKIYIGKHSTYNLDDGYMGSSKYLWNAIRKYGIENFTKEILEFCDTEEDAYKREKEIVNIEFMKSSKTYNRNIGGKGWNSESLSIISSEYNGRKDIRERTSKRMSECAKHQHDSPIFRAKRSKNLTDYNKSERGRKTSSLNGKLYGRLNLKNSDSEFKLSCQRGKIIKIYKLILDNNLNPYDWYNSIKYLEDNNIISKFTGGKKYELYFKSINELEKYFLERKNKGEVKRFSRRKRENFEGYLNENKIN